MNIQENAKSNEVAGAMNMAGIADKGNWKFAARIERFKNDQEVSKNNPFNVTEFEKNILVNSGINLLLTLLAGGGGTAFNNSNAHIGVGDDATAASAAQTDLVAASNKLRKAMNVSYPTYGTSQQIVFQADFTGAEANFDWQEFAVFNASSGGTMLNRKVSDQGTKISGQTWRVTITITIS